MKKNSIIILLAATVLATTACSYQANNSIDQADVNEGSEWVYGVHPDSAAKQLQNVYTPVPENEKRAAAIQEKLYGAAVAAVVTTPVAVDSTAK
jgi:uncharacterized membrane protein